MCLVWPTQTFASGPLSNTIAAMDARATADGARADDRAEADSDPVYGAASVPDLSHAIVAAQSGHEMAFRTLYRAVHPGLLRYLRGLVADEAEDVASETWGQIARDLGTFRGDAAAFRGWAATIARHRA